MTTREPSAPPRLAAIDVGTNTIRLIVAEVQDDDTYRILDEEREMVRLGEKLDRTGRLSDAAVGRALEAIGKMKAIADGFAVGQATGELIRAQVAELADNLKLVQGAEDVNGVHSARISAKRLRYLLEPLARRAPGVKGLVTQLKEVQDTLGDLHDRHVMAEEIASTRLDLSGINSDRLAGCEPGLRTPERLALEQADVAFARFDTQWIGEHAGKFFQRVERLATSLAEGVAAAPAPGVQVLSLGQARRADSTGEAPETQEQRRGKKGWVLASSKVAPVSSANSS